MKTNHVPCGSHRDLHLFRSPLALLAVLALAACGGGDGDGGADAGPEQLVVTAAPSLDGYLEFDTVADAYAAVTAGPNATGGIRVGDFPNGVALRGFVRFDLGFLPAGATIVSAVLRLTQAQLDGDPYGLLCLGGQPIQVYDVDIGLSLGQADWNSGTLVDPLLPADAANGWKTIDATAAVAADVAGGEDATSFRLQCWLLHASQAAADELVFQDGEQACFYQPAAFWIPPAPQHDVTYTLT
jgi:hypothetical protein